MSTITIAIASTGMISNAVTMKAPSCRVPSQRAPFARTMVRCAG
jgi:hypothetical protein